MHVPPFSLEKQLCEIGPELEAALLRVLRSGQYIGGPEVQAFEESFASNIGVGYAVLQCINISILLKILSKFSILTLFKNL